jgi:hypothetical protein
LKLFRADTAAGNVAMPTIVIAPDIIKHRQLHSFTVDEPFSTPSTAVMVCTTICGVLTVPYPCTVSLYSCVLHSAASLRLPCSFLAAFMLLISSGVELKRVYLQ